MGSFAWLLAGCRVESTTKEGRGLWQGKKKSRIENTKKYSIRDSPVYPQKYETGTMPSSQSSPNTVQAGLLTSGSLY